ncbi:CLUMA_CG012130, isoform A [Clunio marinus]|uniref:Luciferin 4-monooxygenase n=1 Tax=Clunio marinus TaxID=568069 RepID=A0A1J1IG04_9DIPT|nr:CLUMA_CG012130, isoform A [Clunio marinus]
MFNCSLKFLSRPQLLLEANRKLIRRSFKTSQVQQELTNDVNDHVLHSPYASMDYPNCTLDQHVWRNVRQWDNKPAVIDGITDRSVSYGQLRDHCRVLAIRLQTIFSLNPHDVIAVCLPNSIEFPIVCLAASEAGIVTTTINPIYTPEEISRQLNDSNSQLLVGVTSMSGILRKAVELSKRPIKIVYVKETESELLPADGIDFNQLINSQNIDMNCLKNHEQDPNDVVVLPYSSGTTGLPKGVMITHRNIICNSMGLNSEMGAKALVYPAIGNHQDTLPCVLPFFHIYGFTCTLLSKLAVGCKLVTLPKFTPDTYLRVLERYESSVLHLVPPIIIFMSNYEKLQLKHTKSIKNVMSGAAPLGAQDVEKFQKKAPNSEFLQGFGLTEASPVINMSTPGSKNYGSVGCLIPDTEGKIVAVDDPKYRGVGPNVSGELWVRGPQVMKGYHNNPEATRNTITSDGWLKTGDIGHYDENGEFYITDRLKELIKVKGFQVAPAELEALIRSHPNVADAAVIGVPHDRFGEVPKAFVVRKNSNLNEEEIKSFVAGKVAEYKQIDGGVEFIESIPKNATGKILRRSLKELNERLLTTSQVGKQRNLGNNESDVVVASPFPSINYPDYKLHELIWNNLHQWDKKTAVIDGITDRSVSYGQLRDHCRVLAIRLQTIFSLNPNDVIAVCLPNSIEFPIVCLAASEAGIVTTTINPIYTPEEISRQLEDSNSQVLFTLAALSDVVERAVSLTKRTIKIVYVKDKENNSLPAGGIDFNELLDSRGIDLNGLKNQESNVNDVVFLPYSSGTTGLSKGVLITHRNVVCNILGANSDMGGGSVVNPAIGNHQDTLPCILPFFHIYGLGCTLLSKLTLGCRLVTLPKFTPDSFLNVLEKYESSILYLVPPIVIFMSNYEKLQLKHTRSIKNLMSGAAPLGSQDIEKFQKKAPNTKLFQGYGATEASPMICISTPGSRNYGSVGCLIPDTEGKIVAVDDPKYRGVGPNVSGELWVRGPQVMKGYHNNPEATRNTITSDGWLKTGDIGHYDENGEFYITDRLKELIKVKGFQVAPAELEALIRSHPNVADAAVIGVPHDRFGEVPKAFVVRKNSNLNEEEIKSFVAGKVAEYKQIDGGVEFIESIPKNATGKILRRSLRDMLKS